MNKHTGLFGKAQLFGTYQEGPEDCSHRAQSVIMVDQS